MLILRPQPVDHEGKWPAAALDLLGTGAAAAFSGFLAIGGRPRQEEHIKIEFAGGVLTPVLRRGAERTGGANQRRNKETAKGAANARRPTQTKRQHGAVLIPDARMGPYHANGTFQEQKWAWPGGRRRGLPPIEQKCWKIGA